MRNFMSQQKKFFLIKDVNSKYYTLDEYRILIEPEQTDKDETVVYLYSTDTVSQYTYIKACEDKGYNVLVMDGQLDSHIIGLIEQKN